MQHTPGPWEIIHRPGFHPPHIWSPDDSKLAEMCFEGTIDFAHVVGNAHLIAAAPDLLAAVRAAVEMFRPKDRTGMNSETLNIFVKLFQRDPVCQQLRAAWAKAEPGL